MKLLFPARLQCPACGRAHFRLSGAALHHSVKNLAKVNALAFVSSQTAQTTH
ncbi:MAG: hypothetical protein K2X48_01150 [Chitinophagaceae bacterium]|nr:hypothetical protein [Chitinophagaceae bacterium]